MYSRKKITQELVMLATELKQSIEVRDGSRAQSYIRHRVELSDKIFPREFAEGEILNFFLEDRTPGRAGTPVHLFGMEAEVYYKTQEKPAIITLCTSYSRSAIREDLGRLEQMQKECENGGTYIFSLIKDVK